MHLLALVGEVSKFDNKLIPKLVDATPVLSLYAVKNTQKDANRSYSEIVSPTMENSNAMTMSDTEFRQQCTRTMTVQDILKAIKIAGVKFGKKNKIPTESQLMKQYEKHQRKS